MTLIRKNSFFLVITLLGSSSALLLGGCSKGASSIPVVNSTSAEVVRNDRPAADPSAPPTTEIKVTTVVDKSALLSQEFLYGADLQYSSLYDKGMDLYQQSLAIGHIPARFVIAGNELQLIAENQRLYPSQVNHPDQLISRYKILSQTDTTLTISGADSRVFLAEIFGNPNDNSSGLTDPKAKPARDLWIRSFDFVPKGNYLLQQTSVVLADGTVAEFMESVFPRSTLTPGADFQKFTMNPDDPVGAKDGPVARFRFLPGEANFDGENKFAMAQHFDISKTETNPDGVIEWYVTPNITDDELEPVRLAVEGWNRYFKTFKGIERDVMRFKGRLPEGIHLGDPRYNVINWDSRLVAGAAYESQATDPATGKQSHSLIYMPAAWLQIGFSYWQNGQFSSNADAAAPAAPSVAPAQLAQTGGAMLAARLACVRDVRAAGALLLSQRLTTDGVSVKDFGKRLLKDTLFHEVGHSLGLAHNFKGSLSFDRSNPSSMFSTSIMDYNDYEIELAAFSATDSSDGPLLAYDRQAIDTIYNKGADLSDDEPELPACNDAEADNELGGVDPLCIRYDLEKDPTLSVVTALDRINLAKKPGDVTMSESIARVPGAVLTDDALAAVQSPDKLVALVNTLASSLKGAAEYYLVTGKASLAYTLRLNVKSMLEFDEDSVPDAAQASGMHERAYAGVQAALALKSLPAPAKAALNQAVQESVGLIEKTPLVQAADEGMRTKLSAALTKALQGIGTAIETDSANGLPKLRAAVLASLARHPKVPFFFGKVQGSSKSLDLEAAVVGILGDTVTASGKAAGSTQLERLIAAQALATFKGRATANASIAAVTQALQKALSAATDNDSRELAQTLLSVLGST